MATNPIVPISASLAATGTLGSALVGQLALLVADLQTLSKSGDLAAAGRLLVSLQNLQIANVSDGSPQYTRLQADIQSVAQALTLANQNGVAGTAAASEPARSAPGVTPAASATAPIVDVVTLTASSAAADAAPIASPLPAQGNPLIDSGLLSTLSIAPYLQSLAAETETNARSKTLAPATSLSGTLPISRIEQTGTPPQKRKQRQPRPDEPEVEVDHWFA